MATPSPKEAILNRTAEGTASFVDLCSFVAIRQAQDSEEVIRQLLLHCFVLAPTARITRTGDFAAIIEERFGLTLPESRLQSAVDKLLNAGKLARRPNRDFVLAEPARSEMEERLARIKEEEEQVKRHWLAEVERVSPQLAPDEAWETLTLVLRRLFRRHGLQTLSLIDLGSSVKEAEERSIRVDIREVCKSESIAEHPEALEAAILGFLSGARNDQARASYIAHLADSTVSYFSLTVPPEVAARLRSKLLPLDVFLDTNVLFGLIGLAEPETTDAARELAAAVSQYQLPFELRFHEDTEEELRRTFHGLASHLRSRHWPPAVSRAAARARNINTLNRLYHERNAESSISADSFLRPYEHIDVIIREHGAVQYREAKEFAPQVLYDMLHDFQEYLAAHDREKPYEVMMHDIKLLSTVRRLRVEARSSLEARALLVTNDVLLHLFEVRAARKGRRQPGTMLPRQLLQLLRPFIPSTPDFDRSFAETFSAAEFRSLDNRAAAATTKLLEILAAYRDLSEETAAAMLANDMLLGHMQTANGEAEIEALVESALAAENASLQAERDVLAARAERAEKEAVTKVSRALEETRSQFEEEKRQLITQRQEAVASAQEAAKKVAERELTVEELMASLRDEKTARDRAENELKEVRDTVMGLAQQMAAEGQKRAEFSKLLRLLGTMALVLLLAVLSESVIGKGFLPWLANHQHSYALRAGAYLFLSFGLVGLVRPDLRKTAWTIGVLPAVFIIIQLLGGPEKGSRNSQLDSPTPGTISRQPALGRD
jgi:hypothetical protein